MALSATYYDRHVEQLFETLKRFTTALAKAGIEYRLVGGFAVYLHVNERDPMAACLTRDIDVSVDRGDLDRICRAVEPFGFRFRHAAGVDMLLDAARPTARSAVHLLFIREKVRPDDLNPVPDFSRTEPTGEGFLVATVADLVTMKLTSFRLKDQVHIQDMDSVELITAEIEEQLSDTLRERLAQVRRSE